MIEVLNLTKHYGRFAAVEGISFGVKEGEIVGFLGPNGAGKTTTIRILTCYHPASSGGASVAGFDVLRQSMDVRRNVGYLPESVPLYPEMRVREFLRFRGKLRGLPRSEREAGIARVTERCWLADVINRPIGQLSKGFRQRVGLADALLHNPKVLILDEPTSGLDPTQIRETRALIRELAREHTVMLSSHILPEVEAVCQRMIIISRGRIVASGTADELRRRQSEKSRFIGELKGPAEAIAASLKKINGVGDVRCEAVDGWVRATVESQADVREAIAQLAAEQKWPLRELRREMATLEEFFVRVVAAA